MASRAFRVAVVLFLLALAFAARAEGKCGDDPQKYGPGDMLVVTWAIPYPRNALVRFTDAGVFRQLDEQMGSLFPPGYDGPKSPTLVGIYNDTDIPDVDSFVKWEKDTLHIDPTKEATWAAARAALESYFPGDANKRKHSLRGALVEHPAVAQPQGFNVCDCVLQRGVVVYYDNGQEDLYVRTLFQTKKGNETRDFMPSGGWWFSFHTEKIWFPLLLNRLQKQRAWMLLDVLSTKEFNQDPKPWAPHTVVLRREVTLDGKRYYAVRVYGKFDVGNSAVDLEIDPKAVQK